jgi:glycerol kinase
MAAASPLLLAVDQGTSSTKAVLVDAGGAIVARATAPVDQAHPRPGWVEQSADAIWASVRSAVAKCLADTDPGRVAGVGLSTQRESLVLWERRSGTPVGPLLSWQDRRTATDAARLADVAAVVRSISGLPLDPMFSALKARWLLDRHDPERRRARAGELCLGTVDSFLLSRLGGEHLVEVGNAARTQLLNVHSRTWDSGLLDLFDVPPAALPRVVASSGPFPAVRELPPLAAGTPVCAVLGDSHAALFAHAGWQPGRVKVTYGTGSSVMAGADADAGSSAGLCLTVAWDDGTPVYAYEGNIRSSGATLAWLAAFLDATPDELVARAAPSSEGVHLVPGFGGLGAPWWDDDAVGLLSGLTFGTRAAHAIRAALESICFQIEDVAAALEARIGPIETLLADGAPTENPALMQLQADTSGRRVARSLQPELSALGVAHLAGLAAGIWSREDLDALPRATEVHEPVESSASRRERLSRWHEAVARARSIRGGA